MIAMKSSMKDKVEGAFHEAKGKVKEVAGKMTDNPKLEAEGTSEKIAGKVQEKIGQVKKVLGK
ncbi:MAG: CsbD family protein [Geobacteraceae bacterium]|nr:CsbD family protein [Geobacteraceae bacterium]